MPSRRGRFAVAALLVAAIVGALAFRSLSHAPQSTSSPRSVVAQASTSPSHDLSSSTPDMSASSEPLRDSKADLQSGFSTQTISSVDWQQWITGVSPRDAQGGAQPRLRAATTSSLGAKHSTVSNPKREYPEFARQQSKSRGRVFVTGEKIELTDLPDSRLKDQIAALPEVPQQTALENLSSFTFHENDIVNLNADSRGGIFYTCPLPPGLKADEPAAATQTASRGVGSRALTTPVYHSRPGATRIIILDFDGQTVTGTAWNSTYSTYVARPFDTDGDPTTFSSAEQTAIRLVWERVAEDYAPFDVDVTTEEPATLTNTTGRVVFTPDTDANGNPTPAAGYGGIAYVNVFGQSNYLTASPAWVSTTGLQNREDNMAEAASHEMGHNMGLSHDGLGTGNGNQGSGNDAYYTGHGSGFVSWGPIMGTGYSRNVSQWSKGEYPNASQHQDDLNILSGKCPYRTDDHGNVRDGTATALTVSGGTSVSGSGIIERNTDVDVFRFTTGSSGTITLALRPYQCSQHTRGGDLDISAELYNSSGTLVASNNPATDTIADISYSSAPADTYYLQIKGSGAGDLTTGYSNYGSLGQYAITGTIPSGGTPQPSVSLSIAGASMAEAAGQATVTATLSNSYTSAVSVNLGFAGTATLTSDYTRSGTSISIPAGSTTGSITLTAVQDSIDEPNETIIVSISSVTNGTASGGSVTATITDDDATPTVSLSLSGSPMAEAAGQATVTATLSAASGQAVTVNLGFSGTATLTSDYTRSGTSISIPAGSTTGSITLTAVQDTIDEPNETITVSISSATNATASGSAVTATINDDDSAPTVSLSLSGSPMIEAGGQATVTATLSAVSGQAVTVNLGFSGTATLTSDYTRSGTSISIPAGSTTGSITLTAVQDTLDEPNETITVSISSATNATAAGSAVTATINDDDAAPLVTLSLTGSPMAEAAGQATVRATLSAVSAQTVTVSLGFSGTATNGTDYSVSGNSITIPAGSTSGTVTITANNDTAAEGNETVIADITSVSNGTESGTQRVTAFINDDDSAPNSPPVINSISYAPLSPRVGTFVTFTVAAGDPENDDLTRSFDFGDGTTDGSGVHAWAVEGTYTVVVGVSDPFHPPVTSSMQVTVLPPEDDGGGGGTGDGGGGGGTGGGGGGGVTDPTVDSDGDGVSDVNEAVDGTNPLDAKSVLKTSMTLLRLTGKVNFVAGGFDGCSVSGILPALPAKTNFASQILKLDVGGATEVFSLSNRGRAATHNGAIQMKLLFVTNRLTRTKEFLGGPVPFKAVLKFGSWADAWADEGLTPTSAFFEPVTFDVDITFNGRVYTGTINAFFSSKAGITGKFKN